MTHPRLGVPVGSKPANGKNGNGRTTLLEARRRPAATMKKRGAADREESPYMEKGHAWHLALRGGAVLTLATFALVALSQGLSRPAVGARDSGAVPYSFGFAPADPSLLSSGARTSAWPLEDEAGPTSRGPSAPGSGDSAPPGSPVEEGKADSEKEAAAQAVVEPDAASAAIARASRERRPERPSAARSEAGGGKQSNGVKRRTSVAIEEEKIVMKPAAPKPRVLTTEPEVTFRPRPAYPPSAMKKEIEGTVRVKFSVTATGSVKNLEVLLAEPPGPFEASVKEAVSQWRFVPGKDQDGKPMEAEQVYTYRFLLEGSGA